MDSLREGINLRAYGQRDPLVEYKNEAFDIFTEMINAVKREVVELIFKVQIVQEIKMSTPASADSYKYTSPLDSDIGGIMHEGDAIASAAGFKDAQKPPSTATPSSRPTPHQREKPKVGRNDPCPCGSGKKYKHCCGR